MKAILVRQHGGPEVLKLEQVPDLSPAAGQVLVCIKAAGVNPVETYVRAGNYGPMAMPYTPGGDAAGIVESTGAGVESFKAGQRVYLSGSLTGTYAEMALCEPGQLHPLPDQVSFSQGAGITIPYVTAWLSLFHRAQAKPGETLLVHGASGGVGIAGVQIARAAGMKVIGTAGTERGRALVLKQGAHHVVDHRGPGYLDEIMSWTGGKGVDVVLEMLANVNLGKDLKIMAKYGRVVIVGSRGTVEIDPRLTMGKDLNILGMLGSNATEAERVGVHAVLGAGLENGTLRPVVGQEFPLSDAAGAQRLVMEHPEGARGKIVLVP